MKRIMFSIVIGVLCIFVSCEMQNNNPDSVITTSSPTDSNQSIIRPPFISFVDFITPGMKSVALTMNTAENEAEIYYTTDGSTPTKDNGYEYSKTRRQMILGSLITKAVSVPSGCTVKATTYKNGQYSQIATYLTPAEPTLEPPTIFIRGESNGLVIISMKTNDSVAAIYFTCDGSTPTTNSKIYGSCIKVLG